MADHVELQLTAASVVDGNSPPERFNGTLGSHAFLDGDWFHSDFYSMKNWDRMENWCGGFESHISYSIYATPKYFNSNISNQFQFYRFKYFYFVVQPDLFESHADWKELFSDPLIRAIESDSVELERNLVNRLHSILRPFLLRRLKREVEGQMPSKYEHVVRCSLTKRQRVSSAIEESHWQQNQSMK